jgi:hypothetical protein
MEHRAAPIRPAASSGRFFGLFGIFGIFGVFGIFGAAPVSMDRASERANATC